MKFNIPSIGYRFVLTKDWDVVLLDESKNIDLLHKITGKKYSYKWYGDKLKKVPITIETGSILEVSRIYIRSGKKEFDSLIFKLRKLVTKGITLEKTKGIISTFWVSLDQVNTIEFEPIS